MPDDALQLKQKEWIILESEQNHVHIKEEFKDLSSKK